MKSKRKKETRGGRGRNQGLRPKTYKNALKKPEERRSVKKQVSLTPKEFPRVSEAMSVQKYKNFNEFGRDAILKLTEEILTENNSDGGNDG